MKSKIKVLQLHDLFYASLPIKFKLWQLLLNFSQCTACTVTLMARRQVADLVIKMFLSTKSAISLHETNVRLICKGRGSQGLGQLRWHWGGGNTKRCMLIELRGNWQPSIDASVGVDFLPESQTLKEKPHGDNKDAASNAAQPTRHTT